MRAADASGARGQATLALLCLATFVSVVHAAMSSVVLPDLKADFDVPDDELTWYVTAFILAFAIGTVVYGRLGDMFGTRGPLIIGIALFGAASFATAAAPGFWATVGGRAAMGAGATAIPALSIATIVRTSTEAQRGRALGATVAAVGIGFAVGPVIGAALTEEFGWRGPLVATGCAATLLAVGALVVLRGAPGDGSRWFDVPGALLFALATTSMLIALNRLPSHPDDRLGVVAALAIAPAVAIFAVWIWRRSHPFFDPGLLARGRYIAFCGIGFMVQGMHFGAIVLLPLLWTRYHDLSFLEIGIHFVPGALALAFFGATGGFIIGRLGVRIPVVVGTWAAANGAMALFVAGVDWGDWQIAALYALLAAGYGLANAGLLHGATATLGDDETGAGVGFYSLLFFLGGAVSSAAVGAILRARETAGEAWLPLFDGRAPEFSDGFAVVAGMSALAFLIALALGPERREVPVAPGMPVRPAAAWILSRQKPIRSR